MPYVWLWHGCVIITRFRRRRIELMSWARTRVYVCIICLLSLTANIGWLSQARAERKCTHDEGNYTQWMCELCAIRVRVSLMHTAPALNNAVGKLRKSEFPDTFATPTVCTRRHTAQTLEYRSNNSNKCARLHAGARRAFNHAVHLERQTCASILFMQMLVRLSMCECVVAELWYVYIFHHPPPHSAAPRSGAPRSPAPLPPDMKHRVPLDIFTNLCITFVWRCASYSFTLAPSNAEKRRAHHDTAQYVW